MKKFLPFIIGYAIYASVVLICISDVSKFDYWPMFIGWLVTVPLIIGSLSYFIWKHYKNTNVEKKPDIEAEEEKLFPKRWTILNFIREFGHMRVGEFRNEKGKIFHKCSCTNKDGTITEVSFFSQLGELTAQEIKERKDELYVGQMKSGKYYLYSKSVKAWEDVNF